MKLRLVLLICVNRKSLIFPKWSYSLEMGCDFMAVVMISAETTNVPLAMIYIFFS